MYNKYHFICYTCRKRITMFKSRSSTNKVGVMLKKEHPNCRLEFVTEEEYESRTDYDIEYIYSEKKE